MAEEATPPASIVGSDFSVPSSAFRSADLPLLGEEATVVPLQSLERPALCKFQHQLQSQRDTSDWQFSPDMFEHYDTQYGPFQVDATSDNEGGNALCPQFWSPSNSYASHTWAGQNIWCNSPFDEVGEVLQHAIAGARMDPNTNTLLVLPDWPDATWWPRLTKSGIFHCSGYYPTGSQLFTAAPRGQGQCRDMGPIR